MKLSRIVSVIVVFLLLFAMAPVAYAQETEATEETTEATEPLGDTGDNTPSATSGTCGEGLTWEFSGSTLTISGSGAMSEGSPWKGNKERIKTVILTGGVTTVAAEAFDGYEKITAVDFGDSLKEIQEGAFRDCLGLTSISLPATFRLFGPESFFGCTNLETIYCAGGMPSFKGNCLWTGNHISIYYPVNNPWPQEHVQVLMDNFGGRLEVMAATSDTPKPKEVKVEETVPPTTEPPTVPTTQPTLPPETKPVVVTVPPTEATVMETTEAVVYTLPTMVTQPVEEPEDEGLSGGVIAILMIGGVLTFFIVGALVARSVSHRGGKYYD